MRPRFNVVGSILRANVRAYTALGAPVAAVVKNDAYGWGAARVVREIDDVVESYVVGDEDEFWALRMRTSRTIRLLAPIAPTRLAALCAQGGIPNVATADGVAAAAATARADRPATIRVGIVDAAGWSGIRAADAAGFAALCARHDVAVELWTHITSVERAAQTVRTFRDCVAIFRAAGAAIAGTDVASTAWASAELGDRRLRIGAGLFGARLGAPVSTVCAIRVDAPVVEWLAPGTVGWAGYGEIGVPENRGVAILRCGYGDGLPKKLAGYDDILSVGMQYTTLLADAPASGYPLVDADSDVDGLAGRLGVSAHELITGLAHHS